VAVPLALAVLSLAQSEQPSSRAAMAGHQAIGQAAAVALADQAALARRVACRYPTLAVLAAVLAAEQPAATA
jgi:hypothetical protein